MSRRIIVVGAGLGGLTLARSLLRQGVPVALYERAPELAPNMGSGIALTYGYENLDKHLGLGEELSKVCAPYSKIKFVDGDGSKIGDLDLPPVRGGAAYWGVRRSRLVDILASGIPDDVLHLDHELTEIAGGLGGVKARFKNGTEVEGSVVVGCDGLRSKVRELMHGPTVPRDTNAAGWYVSTRLGANYPHADRIHEATMAFGANGTGRHALAFPMGVGDELEMIWGLFHPVTRSKSSDDWEDGRWGGEARRQRFVQYMQDWPDPFPWLAAHARPEDMKHFGLFDRKHLDYAWHRGRVCMLGDACHATLPNAGQGAQTAMGDAIVLARALAECDLASDAAVTQALEGYQAARHPFATKIVKLSRELQAVQGAEAPFLGLGRTLLYKALTSASKHEFMKAQINRDWEEGLV